MIISYTMLRSPNIGLYAVATDKFLLIPKNVPARKATRLEKCLRVKAVKINVAGSFLNGVFVAANSNGIILPRIVYDEDLDILKSNFSDIAIEVIQTKETALGNLILANDNGAIAYPRFSKEILKTISDILNVDVAAGTIANMPIVGSLAIATNKGVLAHVNLCEEEKTVLEDILKVPVRAGTVNDGIPFVKSGIIANRFGAAVGNLTTGPELSIVGEALGLV
jgi:translation initiation factor 6